jgi:hypothetical protein
MTKSTGEKKITFHKKYTPRKFAYRDFVDHNGVKCSIQKSSLAFIDCIWLGADDLGLVKRIPQPGFAWEKVDLNKLFDGYEWIANTRMHLDRKQVKKLIPILQKFVDTGEI